MCETAERVRERAAAWTRASSVKTLRLCARVRPSACYCHFSHSPTELVPEKALSRWCISVCVRACVSHSSFAAKGVE